MDFLRNSNPPYLLAHCQSPTSQSTTQALSKSLQSQARKIVFKKFLTLQKNKKRNAQHDRQ